MTNTTFNFSLNEAADVEMAIYDMFGRQVMNVAHDYYERGRHEVILQTSQLPSGHYIIRFRSTLGEHRAMMLKL